MEFVGIYTEMRAEYTEKPDIYQDCQIPALKILNSCIFLAGQAPEHLTLDIVFARRKTTIQPCSIRRSRLFSIRALFQSMYTRSHGLTLFPFPSVRTCPRGLTLCLFPSARHAFPLSPALCLFPSARRAFSHDPILYLFPSVHTPFPTARPSPPSAPSRKSDHALPILLGRTQALSKARSFPPPDGASSPAPVLQLSLRSGGDCAFPSGEPFFSAERMQLGRRIADVRLRLQRYFENAQELNHHA